MEAPARRYGTDRNCRKLFHSNLAEGLLSFGNFLKNKSRDYEENDEALIEEVDDSVSRFKRILKDNFADEFTDDSIQFELDTLQRHFRDSVNECERLKTSLNAARERNSKINAELKKINSELKSARDSLRAEKLQRKQIETDRENLDYLSEKLCRLLLERQRRISLIDGKKKTNDVTSYDRSKVGDNRLELDSLNENDHDVPKSSPEFQDRCRITKKGGFDETLTKINLRRNSNITDEISNSPVINSPTCTFESTAVGNTLKNVEPVKLNEKPASSQISSIFEKCSPKSTPADGKFSNSTSPRPARFECDICQRSFSKKIDMLQHRKVHLKTNQSFHRAKCGKSFPKQRGLKVVKYSKCNTRCATLGKEKKKERTKETANVENLRCDICGRYYSNKYTLQTHIRQKHDREKPFTCTTCGKSFAQKGNLKTHKLVHGSEKLFQCEFCDRRFKTKSAKINHQRIIHKGEDVRFQCAHCDQRCRSKKSIISHIREQHFSKTLEQFECIICRKKFKYFRGKSRHEWKAHGKGQSFITYG